MGGGHASQVNPLDPPGSFRPRYVDAFLVRVDTVATFGMTEVALELHTPRTSIAMHVSYLCTRGDGTP